MNLVTEPAPPSGLDRLRCEIEDLDAQIVAAVQRRTELAREASRRHMTGGAPAAQHRYELDVLERYAGLGPEGRSLALTLLRLGRGRANAR